MHKNDIIKLLRHISIYEVHAYLLMNNMKIGGSPFTKGFLEELKKVKDARVEGYLRIIERLNLEIHEASKRIYSEALNDWGC